MKLFQFWHANPPPDVLALMEAVKVGQTAFEYVRFDDASARLFVSEHYGARGVAAWDACVLPAMRSDLLRLLLMDVHGGIYADATFRFAGDLSDRIASIPYALMFVWNNIVMNGFLMFRASADPYVRACIALTLENIEARRFGSVLMAAGPGVLNSVRAAILPDERVDIVNLGVASPDWIRGGWEGSVAAADRLVDPIAPVARAFRAITLMPFEAEGEIIRNEFFVSHRGRDDYWHRWKGSIYR